LSIIHGAPGTGKTAWANQIAAEAGCPALYVSLEMQYIELMHRHCSRITHEFIGKFRRHELHPDTWLRLMKRTVEELPLLRIVDATRHHVSLKSIEAMAIATRGESKHLLIVIDSLHAWVRRTQGGATQYDALGELITSFTALAAQLRASVIAISEQNRSSRGSNGQDASSGHGGIEYSGELVLALTRDGTPPDTETGERRIELTCAKNRHGDEDAQVQLYFCGREMAFRESGMMVYASRNGKAAKAKY
jgi:replicative DNA helicase